MWHRAQRDSVVCGHPTRLEDDDHRHVGSLCRCQQIVSSLSLGTFVGSADNSCMLWDVQTGDKITALETKSAVRCCGWSYVFMLADACPLELCDLTSGPCSYSGNQIFFSTDKAMGQISELFLYTLADINKPDGVDPLSWVVILFHSDIRFACHPVLLQEDVQNRTCEFLPRRARSPQPFGGLLTKPLSLAMRVGTSCNGTPKRAN